MLYCPSCHQAVPLAPHQAGHEVRCPHCGNTLIAPPATFDPYYTWLGIPPTEQPPNHYRLLGLQLFEANPQVIEHAADRQMKHLHAFKTGPRANDSQRLLTEVSAARVVLLNPGSKAVYDHALHQALAERAMASAPPAAAHTTAPGTAPPDMPVATARPSLRPYRRRRPRSMLMLAVIITGGLIGCLLGVMGVFYLTGNDLLGLSGKLKDPDTLASTPEGSPAPQPTPSPERPSQTAEPTREPTRHPNAANPPAQPRESQPPVSQPPVSQPPPTTNPPPPEPKTPATPATPKSPTLEPAPASRSLADLLHPHENLGSLSAIALPAIDSADSVPLVRFNSEPRESLVLSLVDDIAGLTAKERLEVAEDPQGRGWAIKLQGDGSSTPTPIAIVRRDQAELRFSWVLPVTAAPVRRKLSNCLLIVQHGAEAFHLQLREPAIIPAPVLDLNKDEQTIDIPLIEPPALADLHIRFERLSSLPRGGKLKGGGDAVSLAKTVEIEFADMPGPVLHLRVLRPLNKLSVRIEPRFHEDENRLFGATGGEWELTFSQLEKYRSGLETQLAKSRTLLPNVQSEVEKLNRNLTLLTNTRPATPQQQTQLNMARTQAKTAVEAGTQRVSELQSQITQSQVKLSAIPEIKAFLDALHRKATLRFRIYGVVSGHEFVLADATRDH